VSDALAQDTLAPKMPCKGIASLIPALRTKWTLERIMPMAGNEPNILPHCRDCGAAIGERHQDGCGVECCPYCGGQLLSCLCGGLSGDDDYPPDDRLPWDGIWPGERECREFGWFAKRNWGGVGWVPCEPDEPGAIPDLNRLHTEATWSRKLKRWVLPSKP
jgi:hypothetical protein